MAYRTLVIGLGQIGMGYDLHADPKTRIATLARAFAEHPDFELCGGVDSDPERRGLFEHHYARPGFSCIQAAMDRIAPEVVAVAVPTAAHFSVLSEVLNYSSVAAVLCEKPLSSDLVEATKMVDLAASAKVRLYVNYMRRCDRAVIEIRRRLRAGEIAGSIKGVCWYSKGLFNNGSHFLNLLEYWLGDVIDFRIIDVGRCWAGEDPEPDLIFRFQSGEVHFLAAREENYSHQSVELIAANGRLRYERGSMLWQKSTADTNNAGYIVLAPTAETIESVAPHIQWSVADQLSQDLAGLNTSICTGQQGLSTIQILTQVKNRL